MHQLRDKLRRHRPLGPYARAVTGGILAVIEAVGRLRRPPTRADGGQRRKVYFLVTDVTFTGGIVRTVVNVASYLAADHDVEIISMVRAHREPQFEIDPRVKLSFLLDRESRHKRRSIKSRLRRFLDRRPSWMVSTESHAFGMHSLWLDLKMLQWLHRLEPGVLITTRHRLSVIAARFARKGTVTIAQEHMNFTRYTTGLERQMVAQFHKLDAVAVLTSGDERDYQEALAGTGTRIVRIPNATPEQPAIRADLASKQVTALGRYEHQKGFDLLIRAFKRVVAKHPDWQLRIYGEGGQRPELEARIIEAGLQSKVELMGKTSTPSEDIARSSIFVMSSRYEGFGMVLIEAMAVGLPIVSFDCPRGPGDIITDGVDGTLVPPQKVRRLAAGIIDLIENPAKRRAYSEAALRTASSYNIEAVGAMWRDTIDELLARQDHM